MFKAFTFEQNFYVAYVQNNLINTRKGLGSPMY